MSVPVQDIGGKCENSDEKGMNGSTKKGKHQGQKGRPTETPITGANGRSKQIEKKNKRKHGKKNKVKVAAINKGAAEN